MKRITLGHGVSITCAVLYLVACVPKTVYSHEALSYPEMIEKASQVMSVSQSGLADSLGEDLRTRYPQLMSQSLFTQGLLQGLEQLADHSLAAANLSQTCLDDVQLALDAVKKRKGWGLQMVDAIGKPPPDLEGFNLVWPGSYKECRSVQAVNASTQPALFKGKYCTANVILLQMIPPYPSYPQISAGVCSPDSCSATDITVLLNIALQQLKIGLPLAAYAVCPPSDKPLNGLAIAGLSVVALFLTLMLVGTVVDVLYVQMPKWRAQSLSSMSTNLHNDMFKRDDDDIVLLGTLPYKVPEPGVFPKVLIAFSVYTNGAKLLSTQRTAGTLDCIHGVRFLSMTWVVLGHTFLIPISAGGANIVGYFSVALKRWTFQGIVNATVSVDSFFVLSGLLVSYLALKELKRTADQRNWGKFFLKFYFHRFWRLTPPYMLIIFLYVSLGPYWGSGPLWPEKMADRDNCRSAWWTNLLYINNFVKADKVCLGQSWYLANDMQFYILSPLIFIPLYCSPLFGGVSVLVFLLATTITPAAITMKDHFASGLFQASHVTGANYQVDYYVKPYNRMGPYLVGMVTGYLLYRTECRLRMNKVVVAVCWMLAGAVALAVLYGLYHSNQGYPLSLPLSAFYNATSRTAWGAALAWVIFACVTGNGGFVNTILSWRALVPLSRLTYAIYLLHILVLVAYVTCRDSVFYFSDANIIALFLALLVGCYMLSAVVSLAFEAPMLALEKLVLASRTQ